jgi:hypothetical protein
MPYNHSTFVLSVGSGHLPIGNRSVQYITALDLAPP